MIRLIEIGEPAAAAVEKLRQSDDLTADLKSLIKTLLEKIESRQGSK